MLIDSTSQLTAGDIMCVRLATGEELIARIHEIPANLATVTVTKPILLQIHVDQNGQPVGIGFGAFMVGVAEDAKFTIKREHMLVSPMRARDDLKKRYHEMTSTIELPKKGLIV